MMPKRVMKSWTYGALCFALYASVGSAQTTLRVRAQSETGGPLAGALVALVDSANRVIVEALSTADGMVSLNAESGLYRIRVRRIGFRPFYSGPTRLPQTDILSLRVESPRVVLNELVVSASAQCGRINRDAQTLASLWEEISKALLSSQLTVADLKEISRVQTFRRELGLNGEVLASDSINRTVANRRPFASVDPAALVELGYVRGNERTGWEFFAPDESVLLSAGFASTHCFRALRQRNRPGEIGLAFEPAPKRRLSDIKGVIWLDERSSELREVEFRFVNAGVLSEFEPRGFSRFRRMPSGAWLVSDWLLHLPKLGRAATARNETRIIGVYQNGGKLILGASPPPTERKARVAGVVFDSLFLSPLNGAIVTAAGRSVKADEAGRFAFAELPAGPQLFTVTHRLVSSLGLVAYETNVDVRSDTALVLTTSSRRTVWMRICKQPPDPSDSEKGILHGMVRNERGEPLDSARVTVRLDDSGPAGRKVPAAQSQSLTEVRTDRNGHYAVCGFRRLASGTVSATRNTRVSERKAFEFGGPLVIRRDFTIARTDAEADTRELVVSVTDAAGDPISDATVEIEGAPSSMRTSEDGRAILRTPLQELAVGIRRTGFASQTIQIRLGQAKRQVLKVVLDLATPTR